MNSICGRLEQATIRSTMPWTSTAVRCSRRAAATISTWLPAGNRVNCRAIVGDSSPRRRSSRHSSASRSRSASRRQTQLLCRWSNSATWNWDSPSSRTKAWTIQASSNSFIRPPIPFSPRMIALAVGSSTSRSLVWSDVTAGSALADVSRLKPSSTSGRSSRRQTASGVS